MEIRNGDLGGKQVEVWCYETPEFKTGDVLECWHNNYSDKLIRIIDVVWSGLAITSGLPVRCYVYQAYDEYREEWEGSQSSSWVPCKGTMPLSGSREQMKLTWEPVYKSSAGTHIEQHYEKYSRLKALIAKGWTLE